LDFSPQGALFYGLNGFGKTNLLESIFFLLHRTIQRQATRDEMIRFSSDYGFIEGVFSTPDGLMHKPDVNRFFPKQKSKHEGRRRFHCLGFAVVRSRHRHTRSVPTTSTLVRGLPKERRAFIDILMCQIDQEYA